MTGPRKGQTKRSYLLGRAALLSPEELAKDAPSSQLAAIAQRLWILRKRFANHLSMIEVLKKVFTEPLFSLEDYEKTVTENTLKHQVQSAKQVLGAINALNTDFMMLEMKQFSTEFPNQFVMHLKTADRLLDYTYPFPSSGRE